MREHKQLLADDPMKRYTNLTYARAMHNGPPPDWLADSLSGTIQRFREVLNLI